jgi:hypothetical protein
MDFLGKDCMKSWLIILCIFLYGCASKQPSSYREISAQNFSKSNKYWHICKNQTLGDLDPINVHLGNEFVTQITTVYAGLKNKLIITDGDKLSTLELIAKPVNGNSTYSRRDAKGEVFLKSFQIIKTISRTLTHTVWPTIVVKKPRPPKAATRSLLFINRNVNLKNL